ncbi:hypothetical protein [Falsirhodobacter sp. 1013]|uniref:hypothetical protein n=1 Tax=Falsirhodobacter sp. 1013 TaxID=3417566 RepID=UPI003EB7E7B1
MRLLNVIRQMALREKLPIREITRRTGLSRNTNSPRDLTRGTRSGWRFSRRLRGVPVAMPPITSVIMRLLLQRHRAFRRCTPGPLPLFQIATGYAAMSSAVSIPVIGFKIMCGRAGSGAAFAKGSAPEATAGGYVHRAQAHLQALHAVSR